jgi:hypothetical protein
MMRKTIGGLAAHDFMPQARMAIERSNALALFSRLKASPAYSTFAPESLTMRAMRSLSLFISALI